MEYESSNKNNCNDDYTFSHLTILYYIGVILFGIPRIKL